MAQAPLLDWLTTEPPEPEWLVPGVLARGTIQVIAGDPGVGKTVLGYSLAVALAFGGAFLGRPVEQGKTLYFDEENSDGDSRAYLHTVWRGLGCPPPAQVEANFHLERFGLTAFEEPWGVMMALTHKVEPNLIVLDTATPCCHIQEENDNAEASRAIRQLRRIKAEAPEGCTILVLKHARWNYEAKVRDIRGAKAWKGEADGVLFHTAGPGRPPGGGWRRTFLEPGKVRAFGLRSTMTIEPVESNGGYLLVGHEQEGGV